MTDLPLPATPDLQPAGSAASSAPAARRDHALLLCDGRRLSWAEYGDPGGRPVIVLHGTPGSRLQVAPIAAAAREQGVRVIAPDRPGCGLSSPAPAQSFGSYAEDLRQLLDELHLPQVTIAGVSGGGGFALAAAALLPDRVARLVLVCAMVPGAPADALRNQAAYVRRFFALGRRLPRLTSLLVGQMARSNSGPGPKLEKQIRLLPEADQRIYRAMASTPSNALAVREAVRQGARAAVAEIAMYGKVPPPFDTVTAPTVLLHGAQDVNVPIDVARWVRDQLPDAELVEVPDAAHMFLFERPELLLERVV